MQRTKAECKIHLKCTNEGAKGRIIGWRLAFVYKMRTNNPAARMSRPRRSVSVYTLLLSLNSVNVFKVNWNSVVGLQGKYNFKDEQGHGYSPFIYLRLFFKVGPREILLLHS